MITLHLRNSEIQNFVNAGVMGNRKTTLKDRPTTPIG